MTKIVVSLCSMLWLLASPAMAQYTEWSAPVNMGPAVNSPQMDSCVAVSKHGLSLIFASNRHTGNPASPDWDLFVTHRASLESAWQPPQPLPNVNSSSMDSCPTLSLDEHRLIFVSTRPGGCGPDGTSDLYISRRLNRRDDFGWGEPRNLGCASDGFVNSPSSEWTPAMFEDDGGEEILYFSSDSLSPGNTNLIASRMRPDGTFGPPVPVSELNTDWVEQGFAVRRDGREIIFGSNRPGSLNGSVDLWVAVRESTSEPWSAPVNLVMLNSPETDGGKMSLSFDGRTLYFRSNRDGGLGSGDLYYATREKLGR